MKKLIIQILIFFIIQGFIPCFAQNTLSYDSTGVAPEGNLKDIAWIAGHWKGEAFGGITEEVWTSPLGGSMMGSFKLVVNNEVNFYEILTIAEEGNSLILRLKHFHGDLKGWEEKDETVDFPLVKMTSGKVYFDDFTFERISENEMNIYVVIGHKDGTAEEVKFAYKKSN
ncbi:DUF6265 family protein [Flexithrix dorotheae]|uniref:DUF6265 family protein n=1 Tax=Flexithrix dorotheae TaxID=70993 RepID=UPI00035C3FDD|nr:DUF6265 family protein [Flexithrix dorotheae]